LCCECPKFGGWPQTFLRYNKNIIIFSNGQQATKIL
jgi:hypothetical protein